MATQNPELNLKGRDAGWEGKQVQSYTCSDCGALVSNPNQMNAWHTSLTNQLNALSQAIQNEAQARQQADTGLSNRISALGG